MRFCVSGPIPPINLEAHCSEHSSDGEGEFSDTGFGKRQQLITAGGYEDAFLVFVRESLLDDTGCLASWVCNRPSLEPVEMPIIENGMWKTSGYATSWEIRDVGDDHQGLYLDVYLDPEYYTLNCCAEDASDVIAELSIDAYWHDHPDGCSSVDCAGKPSDSNE